jgi:hypothetical protein
MVCNRLKLSILGADAYQSPSSLLLSQHPIHNLYEYRTREDTYKGITTEDEVVRVNHVMLIIIIEIASAITFN